MCCETKESKEKRKVTIEYLYFSLLLTFPYLSTITKLLLIMLHPLFGEGEKKIAPIFLSTPLKSLLFTYLSHSKDHNKTHTATNHKKQPFSQKEELLDRNSNILLVSLPKIHKQDSSSLEKLESPFILKKIKFFLWEYSRGCINTADVLIKNAPWIISPPS